MSISRSLPPSANTKRATILRLLIDAHGGWVPLPKIIACAAQYNARIHELRHAGFEIENRTEAIDGQRHSWFRLSPAGLGENAQSIHVRDHQAHGLAGKGREYSGIRPPGENNQEGRVTKSPALDYNQRTRELHDQAMPLFAGVKP